MSKELTIQTITMIAEEGNKGALAQELAQMLLAAMQREERMQKALLLAARWFKLNFDDETLHEHPPSKADLAGMFDAMQEARLGNKPSGK